MAKRLNDSEKWRKPWFRSLNGRAKIVWIYLTDNCDHAGFWPAAFDLLSVDVGFTVTPEELEKWYGERVQRLGDKYFLSGFIEFQYGKLNPQNRVHASVLKLLEKESIQLSDCPEIRGLLAPSARAKDKDKDKDKDKEGGVGETTPTPELYHDRVYAELTASIFVAVRSHPSGDPSIGAAIGPDWEWVSASKLMNTFRQTKDDDFSRKRLATDLRAAHERFLARAAPLPLETPGAPESAAFSQEPKASEQVTPATELPNELQRQLAVLRGKREGA